MAGKPRNRVPLTDDESNWPRRAGMRDRGEIAFPSTFGRRLAFTCVCEAKQRIHWRPARASGIHQINETGAAMNRLAERRVDAKGRSTGRRKKRTPIAGQFIARPREMNESPAFRVLTLSAHRVLARVEIEHCAHGGVENGRLPVTYDDFVNFGITRECIRPAINLLVALGFLEITETGRAGNAEFRKPNLFQLTYLATAEENPTHDWRKVQTLEDAKRIARGVCQKHHTKAENQ